MLAAGLERVIVVLGHDADAIRARVDFGAAEVVIAEDWADGQAASLRRGLAAARRGRRGRRSRSATSRSSRRR